jgi:bifunctional N-acetylglucosamine-1-phosphate-uridyltransferase/glucosamine-1-phosphate-acetyltransferase GlmU-like protein
MKILERIKILPKKKENKPTFKVLILQSKISPNSYGGKILGRSLTDWVAFACNGMNVSIIEYDGTSNLIEFVKGYIDDNFDYTIVLRSSTPLITKDTITAIIEYCSFKEVCLCKLPVGYVINNRQITKSQQLNVDSLYTQNLDDFYVVENKKQFIQAEEILQNRINSFHINNGVEIRKTKSVYIEPEVDISEDVIIFPGNSLKGETQISKGVILKENNVIENTQICNNSCISSSVIEKSKIEENVYISSFCDIKNSTICENTIINSGCKIYNQIIKPNSKIKAGTILGEEDDSDSGTGQSR